MTDTRILMGVIFLNLIILSGIVNFAQNTAILNCGDEVITDFLDISNMGNRMEIEKDSEGNPILKKDKEIEMEVFPNMADADVTTDSCELYQQWSLDWEGVPLISNVAEWLKSTCVDITDWSNTIKVDTSGIFKPAYSFYSTLKLLVFYPDCTGIPTILMAFIFLPMIVGVAYILVKLIPFVGGG